MPPTTPASTAAYAAMPLDEPRGELADAADPPEPLNRVCGRFSAVADRKVYIVYVAVDEADGEQRPGYAASPIVSRAVKDSQFGQAAKFGRDAPRKTILAKTEPFQFGKRAKFGRDVPEKRIAAKFEALQLG